MGIRTTILATAILVIISSTFYTYYKISSNKIDTLVEANSKLTMAIEEQKNTIAIIKSRYEQQASSLTSLLASNATLTIEKENLSNKLMKHDLEELSRRKPGLVEKRINDGTKELFDSFITITTE
jgi:regulator of replication initiation timing